MRFVTLNLWGTHAPLTERLDEAGRQLAALEPDVIFLQEVRVDGDQPSTAHALAGRLGAAWQVAYACATAGGPGVFGPGSAAGEEGLAILARQGLAGVRHVVLPDAREHETRILLSARVGDVWCHTTHLHWRVADGAARERQVVAIDRAIEALGDALHVLGGDFNTTPDSDEIRYLRGLTTLEDRRATFQDAWHRVHHAETGPTWVAANPGTEELGFLERPRRIDYLFVSREQRTGRGRVLDAQVVFDRPGENGVWPSDHLGVLADVKV